MARTERKSRYISRVEPRLAEIQSMCRAGLTDQQIAKNIGIAYSTFKLYKKKFSAFSATLKKGKAVIDAEVENSLYKRAMGFEYEEITEDIIIDPITGQQKKHVKKVKKYLPPDPASMFFWLKNRNSKQWRDKQEIEHSGDCTVNVNVIRPKNKNGN